MISLIPARNIKKLGHMNQGCCPFPITIPHGCCLRLKSKIVKHVPMCVAYLPSSLSFGKLTKLWKIHISGNKIKTIINKLSTKSMGIFHGSVLLYIQWFGGSDKRSVWGIHIPYIFLTNIPYSVGSRSYESSFCLFPKHLSSFTPISLQVIDKL